MKINDQIICKITFSDKIVSDCVNEYSGYLDEIDRSFFRGDLYIEEIQNGILIIFRNFDAF